MSSSVTGHIDWKYAVIKSRFAISLSIEYVYLSVTVDWNIESNRNTFDYAGNTYAKFCHNSPSRFGVYPLQL